MAKNSGGFWLIILGCKFRVEYTKFLKNHNILPKEEIDNVHNRTHSKPIEVNRTIPIELNGFWLKPYVPANINRGNISNQQNGPSI